MAKQIPSLAAAGNGSSLEISFISRADNGQLRFLPSWLRAWGTNMRQLEA